MLWVFSDGRTTGISTIANASNPTSTMPSRGRDGRRHLRNATNHEKYLSQPERKISQPTSLDSAAGTDSKNCRPGAYQSSLVDENPQQANQQARRTWRFDQRRRNIIAPCTCRPLSGWRAMLSTADPPIRPMPKPTPNSTMPAPERCRDPCHRRSHQHRCPGLLGKRRRRKNNTKHRAKIRINLFTLTSPFNLGRRA